ncbi:MAG TPA: PqqD family protein [Thermoleophilaceae bacterium]|nr:PqqD family protein [Thermoleophilaceae bacterium]
MSDVVRLKPGALEWREVEGELIALDVQSSTYFAVNRTAASIWPALVEGSTRTDLIESLTGRFGIEHDVAARDLDAFLEQMSERSLLED